MKTLFGEFFNQKHVDIRQQRQALADELKKGPRKVSMLAEATQLDKKLVMWNLMGMLRWGDVEVSGEEDHELVFTLREV
jgi:thiamine monophosphate kinase